VYEWDLTSIKSTDEIARSGAKWHDDYLPVSASGRVRVRFDGTRVFDRRVDSVTFTRNGNKLEFVRIALEPQVKEDLRRTAMEIAEQWGAPTDSIARWDGKLTVILRHRDRNWTIDQEVVGSIVSDRPYALRVEVWTNEAVDELHRSVEEQLRSNAAYGEP
jgi:hypothetical protein